MNFMLKNKKEKTGKRGKRNALTWMRERALRMAAQRESEYIVQAELALLNRELFLKWDCNRTMPELWVQNKIHL